ncbi:TetR/AcrR family transcriptional regulator [Marinivivus vitaminiproducens]|uniref:TetR/AcrR family transcriptional regulator n=1 Tax=Marinivivus vitaminiproducens TaxID=3035935 RepID=UPI00279D9A13|nr:TetR/AcrR family transcriptional regulator [Geminicoccaceae bacterium SCSIO 64248]
MARPSSFDRDAALHTAMTLFKRHGYDGVAISDLTAAIGIAAPSLYGAFGTKAELYRKALRHYRDLPASRAADVFDEEGTAREAVARTLRAAVAAVTEGASSCGCMVSTGLLGCGEEAASLAQETAALRAAWRSDLAARLERARDEGELPAHCEPAEIARFYAAVMQGISVQAHDGATREELSAIVDQALTAWPT